MTLAKESIDYIISFLLYGNEEAAKHVHLSAPLEWDALHYPMDITSTAIELRDGEAYVSPDLIYNTFFYISRAEELLNPQRDEHGRFLAKYSILGENNRLHIPQVDEYARMLMKSLDIPMPPSTFANICLTHDVDTIAHYRHLRGALGGIYRGEWKQVLASWKNIGNDPAFTFPWLISQDAQVKDAEIIYFVKDTPGWGFDYPQYNLRGRDWHYTRNMLYGSNALIGLHSSYYGHIFNSVGYTLHRSHYLCCPIPQLRRLAKANITDDYTMSFPDQAGFRLQTTRPVRWIDPETGELSSLTLHPLTIMDCTLSAPHYMNLNEDEAYFEAERLIEKVRQCHGELVLLWHNTSICKETYHKSLYPKILSLL